eukprot:TRINITY_DN7414_c1_g3_i1.p1 TRINITY_DN7414_c1_g3~~TRINITY_DN7414_c1_g3_i1.p1  ORF type:complete len:645 (-),score=111.04 TRINITY_DN7414_c1_g3_i1:196-2130(-)
MADRSRRPVIGIDLGTTYSCAGVWRNSRVEIIPNDQGNKTTPSFVAFTGTKRFIGEDAEHQSTRNPQNTVFDVKRFIGRRFSDASVQNDLKYWPFKLISDERDKPMIVVQYKGESKEFYPEQISSFVLTKMVNIAEVFLGSTVKDVVITVPAYFDEWQRQATKTAGIIAGLNVMALLNEPTAAAMAYDADKRPDSIILIFDLGGGTFDISIAEIKRGNIKVIATTGDTHLGGLDFDNNMVSYFIEEIKMKHNKDISGNPRALKKLRDACERAKRTLSFEFDTSIDIDSLVEDTDFSTTISRAQFEDLNMRLFEKCIHTVGECLRGIKTHKSIIRDIVLVGGSTKIPKIQSMLQEFFNGKALCKGINPDEAVAYGAAIHAAYLSNNKVQDMVLHDVTPLSLGTDVRGGLVDVVIPRNTNIPTKKDKVYYTTIDNQPTMSLEVYMGERPHTIDNKLLDKFIFSGLSPAPKGKTTVTVSFEIDTDGILVISAVENNNGKRMEATIVNDQGRLKNEDIRRMVLEAERYRADDENHMNNVKAKNGLESAIIDFKNSILADDNVRSKDKMKIQCLIKPTEEWLKKGGKLVDGDKFRREYEEHASYFHEALEIARNSSKNSAWTRVGKALSVAVSTILPIVVPIVVGISTS